MAPIITAQGLGKRFGDFVALTDFDLAVEKGTVLGLLGHNGAGKTTVVRILTTLSRPSAGRAAIAGYDVVAQSMDARRHLALAGQKATVDDKITGRDNLILLGRLLDMNRVDAEARATALLDQFGLADAGDRLPTTYSGGMRRRLDLAACLVIPKPVLFFDEPTTGLDPASRAEMWAAIHDLVERGCSMVLTTQYLDEADELADQIVVLNAGRTVATGTPAELKRRIGTNTVVVDLRSEHDARLLCDHLTHQGRTWDLDARTNRVAITATDGLDDLHRVVDYLRDAQIDVDEVGMRSPTLDDVFFAYAGPQRQATASKG